MYVFKIRILQFWTKGWTGNQKEAITDTIINNHKQNDTDFNKDSTQRIMTATLRTNSENKLPPNDT